jgi:hypothetical protein
MRTGVTSGTVARTPVIERLLGTATVNAFPGVSAANNVAASKNVRFIMWSLIEPSPIFADESGLTAPLNENASHKIVGESSQHHSKQALNLRTVQPLGGNIR